MDEVGNKITLSTNSMCYLCFNPLSADVVYIQHVELLAICQRFYTYQMWIYKKIL